MLFLLGEKVSKYILRGPSAKRMSWGSQTPATKVFKLVLNPLIGFAVSDMYDSTRNSCDNENKRNLQKCLQQQSM